MFSPEISLPGALVVTGLAIGGLAYAVAPTVGMRLATNSGALAACERGVEQAATDRADDALAGTALPTLPGLDLDQAEAVLGPFAPILTAPLKAAEAQAAQKAARIRQQLQWEVETAVSVCVCRARAAVNKGHTALAVFTATGGLVSWSPVDEWPAAMSAPDVVAQCREVS